MIRIEKILLSLALLSVLGVAVSVVHSFDIFWQLQSGKYMVETRGFIYSDIFSLAAEAPRFEHCWLHDVIFYGAYALAGYSGISVLKGLLVFATGVALAATARVRKSSFAAILLILPPALFLSRGGWLERPQLWSFLLFAVFLWVLEKFRLRGWRGVFILVPLMVLWANLHAGSVLAFAVMAAYLVGEGGMVALKRSALTPRRYGMLWLVLIGLGAAALITPYGEQTVRALFYAPTQGASSGMITQAQNMDWRSTTFASSPMFFYAMGVSAAFLLLGWRRLCLSDLCLLSGVAIMGYRLDRHTVFLFLAMAALLPNYLDASVQPLVNRIPRKTTLILRGMALVFAVFGTVYFAVPAYRTYGFMQTGLRTWHYPVEAADFVREHKLPANIYNTYDWGGYLMWTLYPEYRVFWDGRSDSIKMFAEGLQVAVGHHRWPSILERYQVKTIVTKACEVASGARYPILDRLRENADWALVFADESSMVFVREDSVDGRWLRKYRLPKSRIDDTILSEATLLTRVDPGRYKGWWEMGRIFMERGDYSNAYVSLRNYLFLTPEKDPLAEQYYRMLDSMMKRKG